MKPIIEIFGPWLHNRGDELGLWSVARHFEGRGRLAASSALGLERLPENPALERIRWRPHRPDFQRAVSQRRPGEALRLLRERAALSLVPKPLLAARGVHDGRSVDLLVDCSGYGYGDMWSLDRTRAREAYFARLKDAGSAIVLVPQAFGPFRDPEVRLWTRKLLNHCDLVFARDRDSLDHLADLGFDRIDEVGIAPDVTHLLAVDPPPDQALWARRVAIVPNTRMLDRTGEGARDTYLDFLAGVVRAVQARGLEPVLVVHEDNDLPLVQRLLEADGGDLPVVHEDALVSKSVLGACRAVVASRYHACISSLSQGVPTLGTSWSHKYERLFEDYGAGDLVLAPDAPTGRIDEALARVLGDGADDLAAGLRTAAERQKDRVRLMWAEVDALLASRVEERARRRRSPKRTAPGEMAMPS